MKIALVDDEKNVRLALRTVLQKEGFEIEEFPNGQEALKAIEEGNIADIFVLDIMMPLLDGISLLRIIREKGFKNPVLFLTSRDEEFDKVLGLELGADDYLCKPFSTRELVARIHVLQRRVNQSFDTSKVFTYNSFVLNTSSYTASYEGKPLDLTVTEFRLLLALIEYREQVLSREQLIEIAYPEETYLNDRAIDCHIKRLRKKIPEDFIETVYGLGYKFK